MFDPIDVTVTLTSRGYTATGTVQTPGYNKHHICGSHGYNPSLGDTCGRCEAEREAEDIARSQIDALLAKGKEVNNVHSRS